MSIRTIVFDFGNVIGYFDHQRTFSKLTAFTELKPEEMLTRVYGTDLEDDFDSGRVRGPARESRCPGAMAGSERAHNRNHRERAGSREKARGRG